MSETTVRADLERRLGVLLARVDRIADDLRQPSDRDWQERAIELENDDVLEGLDGASRAEAAPRYGPRCAGWMPHLRQCARCGRAIGEARLVALPYATTCVACASA